ncbi:Integrase/recombinase [Helicobacter suis]|nr:Integrase/recombinase [Helicobacter suis]BDR27640.1 integrase [Helicobacter suis HS1]BCD45416.1 Integrase/recombinase [Helicobacter suis]BCD47112.1 Integrase/recombinase [Helicobacter suis]BCD48402.1 Integrase/recombinase [Helicobacter suis]
MEKMENELLPLSRTQRELFENIKAFLHYKIKNFTPVQALKDVAKVLCYQEEILKCPNISALERLCHALYNQGINHILMMRVLFLFFVHFKTQIKLKSFKSLTEEQVISFLFELAQTRKPSSMAKYVMYLRQFFNYLDRKRGYHFDFSLKNLAFAKTTQTLPKHLNAQDLKAFIKTLLNYQARSSYEKRNKCILLLVILGGLRKSEVLNLELKNIKPEEQNYSILVMGKNRKERKAYIRKSILEQALHDWISDAKRLQHFNGVFLFKKATLSQRTCQLKNFIAKIFKLSNIKHSQAYGTGLHLFRHSFATLIYQETQDLVLTSRALGHNSLLSTKIYIHTTQEHNKKVACVFDTLLNKQ